MGWFWGSDSGKDDPYQKLDPKLREFLDKESPLKYEHLKPEPREPVSEDAASNEYRSQLGLSEPAHVLSKKESGSTSSVPPESLYQDGRYADIWKNYTPLQQIEQSQRSDQDRLADVIDAFNERKAQIGRAAVENCVFEQLAEHDCFDKGGFYARMTMCRTETRTFNRCYTMQSRFLKALGYLSMNRTPEEEEKIQMHADKLYQEMMHREKLTEEAKTAGVPEPAFKPLLNAQSAAEALGVTTLSEAGSAKVAPQAPSGLDVFPVDKRELIEKSLASKSPRERDLEIELLVAEAQATKEYGQKIGEYFNEEKSSRADRRERGRETLGDTIKRMWGWDK